MKEPREAKYKKGKFEDLLYYSILRDEYRKISGGGEAKITYPVIR